MNEDEYKKIGNITRKERWRLTSELHGIKTQKSRWFKQVREDLGNKR